MKIFFLTGTGNRCRCIPVSTIANNLGVEVSHCLPGFHAFMGNVIISFSQIHRMCIPHRGTTQLPQQLSSYRRQLLLSDCKTCCLGITHTGKLNGAKTLRIIFEFRFWFLAPLWATVVILYSMRRCCSFFIHSFLFFFVKF